MSLRVRVMVVVAVTALLTAATVVYIAVYLRNRPPTRNVRAGAPADGSAGGRPPEHEQHRRMVRNACSRANLCKCRVPFSSCRVMVFGIRVAAGGRSAHGDQVDIAASRGQHRGGAGVAGGGGASASNARRFRRRANLDISRGR